MYICISTIKGLEITRDEWPKIVCENQRGVLSWEVPEFAKRKLRTIVIHGQKDTII